MAKPLEDAVDQVRSSRFKVEDWTELGSQDCRFYTQICWKFPN